MWTNEKECIIIFHIRYPIRVRVYFLQNKKRCKHLTSGCDDWYKQNVLERIVSNTKKKGHHIMASNRMWENFCSARSTKEIPSSDII